MARSTTPPSEIHRRFAPGTLMRDAVDMIDQQGTGALILFGTGPKVDAVCSGGFFLDDAPLSAQRLAELAKMDGGIVVDDDAGLVARCNVHFTPDPNIATEETGTRFRTAEQLALQTGFPVLSVSEEGSSLAVVYSPSGRYVLRPPAELLAEANQVLASTSRIRSRLEEASDRLTHLEVDDLVTVHDVVSLLQRAALVRRLARQLDELVVELGGESELITLQVADLLDGVNHLAELVYADYAPRRRASVRKMFEHLDGLATADLHDLSDIATVLGFDDLDAAVRPRGVRALAGVPRLPENVKDALITRYRDLQRLLHASVDELDDVEGVGTARAQQLRTYLDRLMQEGSIVS